MSRDFRIGTSTPSSITVGGSTCDLVKIGNDYVWARPLSNNTIQVQTDSNISSATFQAMHVTGDSFTNTMVPGITVNLSSGCKFNDNFHLTVTVPDNYYDNWEYRDVVVSTSSTPVTTKDTDNPQYKAQDNETRTVDGGYRYFHQNTPQYDQETTDTERKYLYFDANTSAGGSGLGNVYSPQNGPYRTIKYKHVRYRDDTYRVPQKLVQHRSVTDVHYRNKTVTTTVTTYAHQRRRKKHTFSPFWKWANSSSGPWTDVSGNTLDFTSVQGDKYIMTNTGTSEFYDPDWSEYGDRWTDTSSNTTYSDYYYDHTDKGSWVDDYYYDDGFAVLDHAGEWGSWQDASGYPSYGNWQSVTLQTNTPTGKDFWSGSTHIWYTFDYWSLNSTSGAAYSPGQTYSTIANATFYAHWTEHRETDTSY